MSSISQLFWYLNVEKHPTIEEQKIHLTSIQITDSLKKQRRDYRRKNKKNAQTPEELRLRDENIQTH